MENCTVCPFTRYWYVILAVLIVGWAVYKFVQSRNQPVIHDIPGVENLTSANFAAATASGIVLVDFWASWCGPCRMQMPIIVETVPQLPANVKIAKVNIDEASDLAGQFKVEIVPTWIVFKDGKEISRTSGVQQTPDLLKMVEGK